jgi:PAS domain S-box-containing protein
MKKNSTFIFILVLALELSIFMVDVSIPHGYGKWGFYFFPLLLLLNATPIQIISMVNFVTILEILGWQLAPSGNVSWPSMVFNRISGIVIIWTISLLYLSLIRSQRNLRVGEETLKMSNIADVSERKRAQEELLREKSHLSEAQRIAHIGSWVWDPKTDTRIGSDELFRMFGMDPAKDTMPNFREQKGRIYQPADWERLNEAVQKTMQTGVGYEMDIQALRNGERIWITTRGEAVRNAEGRIIGECGTIQDITARKLLEESLRKSETLAHQRLEEIEGIYHNAPIGLCVFDREFRFVRINERMAEFNGFSTHDHIGKSLREILPNMADLLEPEMRHVLETGEPRLNIEIVGETFAQPGIQRSFIAQCLPIKSMKGVVGLSNVVEETTELKRTEKALHQSEARLKILNENLETMVVQRTQQVRDLSKELTIAEQHERQRFSIVLHEDLQQILFGAKMILDTINCSMVEDSMENEKDICEVKSSIQKAIATTKSLAVELNPPILKNEGLDAALRWLARQMQERYRLVINVDIANNLSVVRGVDQILIVQLTRELLYNIVKHAQTSEVVISGGQVDDTAVISIEDKGVGFDVETVRNRPRGFEGLGLFSIVERLKLFGGRLDIQSEAAKGTRITINVPLTILERAP